MIITLNSQQYPYLVPADVALVRIGNDITDGGYVVPELAIDTADAVLSLGIGDDWSFDTHWHHARPNAVIHSYDATIDNYSPAPPIAHYYENVGKQFIRSEFTEFATAMHRLPGNNVFVKMDIEGGEYTLTRDILNHQHRIMGMVIEYHGAASTSQHCFVEELPVLTQHYQCVHIHANNSGPVINGFPDYLELTFLRRDLCTATQQRLDTYMDQLDRPCSTYREDYRIVFSDK
jgi:hypothetical protein